MANRIVLFCIAVKYCAVKHCDGQMLSNLFVSVSKTTNISAEFMQKSTVTPDISEITGEPDGLERLFKKIDLPLYNNKVSGTEFVDSFVESFNSGSMNVDAKLSFRQLVKKYGFEFERHEVLTKDGYLLNLFRIPGRGSSIFLMHGLLGSADDFILAGPESGLAYLLAKEKYDVWLGNARGNKYSNRHNFMSTSEALFWNFSWHEIGIYDVPAMIDYVLGTTNQTSLKYVGYSLGSTAFFVMASEKFEYNNKVSLMIALSPATFMSRARSPIIRLLALGSSLMYEMAGNMGLYEFQPSSKVEKMLRLLICGKGRLARLICSNFIFLLSGFNFEQINATNLPVVFEHFPSGASMKQFTHYAQGLLFEDFKKFDHGSMENLEKYGVIVPPSYALENIVTPISVFYSDSDWLTDVRDVELLSYKLKNVVDIYRVPHDKFNHADYIIARDVKRLVYTKLMNVLNKF